MNPPEALILTDEEAGFGFRFLMVESDGYEPMELQVAYVINESDLLVKAIAFGHVNYLHRRWGIMRYRNWPGCDEPIPQTQPKWYTVGLTFYTDPGEATQRGEFEPDDATLAPIEAHPFGWEPYDPAKHGV